MFSGQSQSIRILALVLCAGFAVAADGQSSSPRTQPDSAIKEGIRLLEAKKYAEFLETFVRPSELAELLDKRSLAETADEFGKRRAADLLAVLRAASALKPALNEGGTRAEYVFEKPIGRERRLQLQKIGEFWYFRD